MLIPEGDGTDGGGGGSGGGEVGGGEGGADASLPSLSVSNTGSGGDGGGGGGGGMLGAVGALFVAIGIAFCVWQRRRRRAQRAKEAEASSEHGRAAELNGAAAATSPDGSKKRRRAKAQAATEAVLAQASKVEEKTQEELQRMEEAEAAARKEAEDKKLQMEAEALQRLREAQDRNDDTAIEDELARGFLPAEVAKKAESELNARRTRALRLAEVKEECAKELEATEAELRLARIELTKIVQESAAEEVRSGKVKPRPYHVGTCFHMLAYWPAWHIPALFAALNRVPQFQMNEDLGELREDLEQLNFEAENAEIMSLSPGKWKSRMSGANAGASLRIPNSDLGAVYLPLLVLWEIHLFWGGSLISSASSCCAHIQPPLSTAQSQSHTNRIRHPTAPQGLFHATPNPASVSTPQQLRIARRRKH